MPDNISQTIKEQQAAEAFSKQSSLFDDIYSSNTIIQYKREHVRENVNKFLKPDSRILELNAGTGEDAIYFAQQGHKVHATDISEGMLSQLSKKVSERHLNEKISVEKCSYTALNELNNKGPFDLIFSNFAGLNCTDQLDKVLNSFAPLLAPNGQITLVVLPPFCLWETLLAFRGRFKTAFRRFNSKHGTKAHIEGVYFTCWYYKPSFIIKTLGKDYELLSLEGLCTIVPPSYLEHFPEKHPGLYKFLKRQEAHLKNKWPWRNIGDYYIITFRRKQSS
ncbi:MAG TPA: class I SAM-dependent methyltransferase [Flavipsychrobacter sp.]|nr:class I SAM-dependent methyltransferase [Flavipsychrobacter sp.]